METIKAYIEHTIDSINKAPFIEGELGAELKREGEIKAYNNILNFMKEKNIIEIPRWFLEHIEDTLRIQHNINDPKTTGETCQDRNIRQALNGCHKLLKGIELTGTERFEKIEWQ